MILKSYAWSLRPVYFRWSQSIAVYLAALSILMLTSACTSPQPTEQSEKAPMQVVTTTALLADMVKNLGGNLVQVAALVPPGADVHSFQTDPDDNIAISQAALLISNGGGLDKFLEQIIEGSAADDAVHIFAAESLLDSDGTEIHEDEAHDDEAHEDEIHKTGAYEHGFHENNPHFWQNPVFAIQYAKTIRDGLIKADSGNSGTYQINFESYKDKLTDLDFEIASTINTIDESRRHLITFHDAFGHFATRYGWRVTSLVGHDASQVSPGSVIEMLETVKGQGIPAVFIEPQFSGGILEQAAEDSGIEVGRIYPDVQDGEASTYIDMMLFNAKSLARLLR